jgi:predicted nucleotidyltransferase component of viral defense system
LHSFSVTPRQAIELFHLLFLRGLEARLEDKTLIALKGGCNLRFYFDSVRYSEDIDLDVATMAKPTLQRKVDQLLGSSLILSPLQARHLSLAEVSAPRQTETTQRWKLGVRFDETGEVVRTKIEFARRGAIEGARIDPVPASFTNAHGLSPFLASHYPVERAIAQKIHALSESSEPQPRDIFDLNLLFPMLDAPLLLSDEERAWLPKAIENATSVSYAAFVGKVVTYLDPDHADLYADEDSFHLLQTTVVDRLEALA